MTAGRTNAFRDVIPVTMQAVDPPSPTAPVPVVEAGTVWGATSDFSFDEVTGIGVTVAPTPPVTLGGEVWEDDENRSVYKVDSIPSEVKEDHTYSPLGVTAWEQNDGFQEDPVDSGNRVYAPSSRSTINVVPYPQTKQITLHLGEEERDEVVGFTLSNGVLQERKARVLVDRFLVLDVEHKIVS